MEPYLSRHTLVLIDLLKQDNYTVWNKSEYNVNKQCKTTVV